MICSKCECEEKDVFEIDSVGGWICVRCIAQMASQIGIGEEPETVFEPKTRDIFALVFAAVELAKSPTLTPRVLMKGAVDKADMLLEALDGD